jgi:hypothetical protein
MAMIKLGSAEIVEPNISSNKWQQSVCCGHKAKCTCGTKSCRTKVARTILAKYDPEKYLLSHCSIIAAVDVDTAKNSKSEYKDYLIKPEYSKFVNNNGDAWTKNLLAKTYRTFIGANNYLEHVQIPELSKGKIIDAVLREVPIGKDKEGKDVTTYYVDILVATERKHKDLVAKIESGEMKTMSMGCKIAYSICTKCGNKAVDESEACPCVKYEKNNTFYGEDGVQRKVAELCGHESDENSVNFIDGSWVKQPAFTGAVIRNVVNPPEDVMAKIREAEEKESYQTSSLDFLKAARIAQDEKTPDVDTKEEDTTKDEAPADDTPTDKAPEDEAPADDTGEAPAEDTGEPPVEETPEDEVTTLKTQLKQKILKELGDQIMDDFSGEDNKGPRELETLEENLINPTAALKSLWKSRKAWNSFLSRSAGYLDKKSFDKLKFGTYILLSSDDLGVLSDYGYSRRDFLAVLSFLDSFSKKPLDLSVKKAVAKINGTHGKSDQILVTALQKVSKKTLTATEIKRSLSWLKAVDSYLDM